MGARGPRKKLPQLEKLDGNPGKRSPLEIEVFALGAVFIPDHLHEDAQACIEVIKSSMPPKVYAKLDSFLLSGFATAWAIHKRAAHEISNPDFEWIVVSEKGTQSPSPWIRILNIALRDMMSAGDRLGLDPKARASLKLPSEGQKDEFDALIGRPGLSHSVNC